jgi:transcription initiation factor TFIIB
MARLRRHHRRAQVDSKADRNRRNAFLEIRRISGQLSLPDCFRDRACKLFAEAQSADLLRGRSLEGFAAAAVYVVCRTGNVARTTAEIVSIARASEAELSAAYDAINRELDVRTGPIDPKQYLARFASRLDVSRAVERRAEDLVDRSREEGLTTGRNPGGVAGGCLYTAAREQDADLTQRAVADVADVAPVTIRETYHALRED